MTAQARRLARMTEAAARSPKLAVRPKVPLGGVAGPASSRNPGASAVGIGGAWLFCRTFSIPGLGGGV